MRRNGQKINLRTEGLIVIILPGGFFIEDMKIIQWADRDIFYEEATEMKKHGIRSLLTMKG